MQLALNQILVQPGQQVLLKDVSWQDFETISSALGEGRAARLCYSISLQSAPIFPVSQLLN